jgi:hypothetical protein
MHIPHDRDIAHKCTMAMVAAGKAKSDAGRLERIAKRVFSQLVITGSGSVALREHEARCHERYIAAEDAYIEAQTMANVLGAEAEGLQLQFEYFRTVSATARAEMQLR